MNRRDPPAGRLRLAIAGCRFFTAAAFRIARDYEGLADIVEFPCETESDRPEVHLGEPETSLTPRVLEQVRSQAVDVLVVPPGHLGREAGIGPERIVPVRLDPLCVLEPPPVVPTGPTAVVVRPALAAPVLQAALLAEGERYIYLPAVSPDHLWSQLAVAKRASVSSVVTEPAAVPVAAEAGLAARSYLDRPSECVVVHAVERALIRATLLVLRRPSHLPAGVEVPLPVVAAPAAVGPTGPPAEPGMLDVVALRTGRRFVVVPQASITYITSLGGVVTAYTDAGRFWTNLSLSDLERRLDMRRFLRIDQSHLVNITRIAELLPWTHQRYRLVFADHARTELVLSRDVGRRLRALLGW